MDALRIAHSWLDQGIAVIPIGYRSKRPMFDLIGSWEQYKNTLPCCSQIAAWFDRPLVNLAIITGWQNLVIVDFDKMPAYDMWQAGNKGKATYTVSTGRGMHLYYFVDGLPGHTLKWWGGEVKSTGYCLAPPSIHPSGRRYQVIDNRPIMRIASIDEIFPAGLFPKELVSSEIQSSPCCSSQDDIWQPRWGQQGKDALEIKHNVRIASFFPSANTGNRWHTVRCPFHGDGRHLSGWIDNQTNRFVCHSCINGSIDVIEFYSRLHGVDFKQAVEELSNGTF